MLNCLNFAFLKWPLRDKKPYDPTEVSKILKYSFRYTESNIKPVLKPLVVVRGRKEHYSARVHECMLSQPHPRLICHIQFQNTEMATLEMSSQGFRTNQQVTVQYPSFILSMGGKKGAVRKKHSLDSSLRQRLKTGRR